MITTIQWWISAKASNSTLGTLALEPTETAEGAQRYLRLSHHYGMDISSSPDM